MALYLCVIICIAALSLSLSLSQSMESQLLDESLLRLWRTGAGTEQFTADEDDDINVSH